MKAVRTGILIVGFTVLAGCATLQDSHGYVPEDALLREIKVGRDTKETVTRIIGLPGTQGIVDDRGWYYVKSDYERFLWRAPKEVNREVVAVTFSDSGQVANIERFGLEAGQVVRLNRRVTTPNTQGVGFLRQLFSNIGNFNPGALFGGE